MLVRVSHRLTRSTKVYVDMEAETSTLKKVECRWGGDSRVMRFPSKAAVRRLRRIYVTVNVAGIAVDVLSRGFGADCFLNFGRPFYSRVWVESAPKNFGGEGYWLGDKRKKKRKKEKDLLNCKYKVTFQRDGCVEPTCAVTCFIHFGFPSSSRQHPTFEMYVCGVLFVCLFIGFACKLIWNVLVNQKEFLYITECNSYPSI